MAAAAMNGGAHEANGKHEPAAPPPQPGGPSAAKPRQAGEGGGEARSAPARRLGRHSGRGGQPVLDGGSGLWGRRAGARRAQSFTPCACKRHCLEATQATRQDELDARQMASQSGTSSHKTMGGKGAYKNADWPSSTRTAKFCTAWTRSSRAATAKFDPVMEADARSDRGGDGVRSSARCRCRRSSRTALCCARS